MSPKEIPSILDLAVEAEKNNEILNPMFTGDAGIGKSFVVQQWVKKKRETDPAFGFLDLRIAYLEAPDLIGKPVEIKDGTGKIRTGYALPEYLPTTGKGIILLEEPNRGKPDIMNALMQLLTDRKIHDYVVPKGWIIAACINPEDGRYDVANMDPALRNRFVEFPIKYNKKDFVDYTVTNEWDQTFISWIRGQFDYQELADVSNEKGQKYVSPRTLAQMQAAIVAGVNANRELHYITATSVLGTNYGKALHAFVFDDTPVMSKDFTKDYEKAIGKLKRHADKENYRADLIAATVDDLVKGYKKISDEKLVAILQILPADQSATLVNMLVQEFTSGSNQAEGKDLLKRLMKLDPNLREVVRSASVRQSDK